MPNNVEVRTQHKEFDLEAVATAKVRLKDPPVQADENGNVKKYTAKELKELKGDPKLPGYAGDFDSLKTGQIIQVKLAKMKQTPKPRGKGEDKDLTENKPVATMIMIVQDTPAK